MAVYSVKKQLFMFGFAILGIAAFIVTLYGLGGSSVVLIANYQSCPSPQLAPGTAPPAGYIPCDTGYRGIHAVLAVTNWDLYSCHGGEIWAPSIIIYLDKTTSQYYPNCGNSVAYLFLGIGGMVAESGIYVYSVRFQYANKKVISFVAGGTVERPTAYANAKFDFLLLTSNPIDYSPEIFGELETEAQIRAAAEIQGGRVHAAIVEYVSNETRGRAVFVMPWNFNEAFNFGEPYTVQIGLFPRTVAGTALVTGVFIGNETRAPIPDEDLKKWGISREIPYWQKSRLLAMLGSQQKGELVPWFQIDDCDARRRDVQNAVYSGVKAKDRLVSAESLQEGKLGAFVQYHDSLPYLQQLEVEKERNNDLEEKLLELEGNAIRFGKINPEDRNKKPSFKIPPLTRTDKILIAIGGLILLGVVAYFLLIPEILRLLITQDINEINGLINSAPASAKPALIAAKQELQQAALDLQSHGIAALGEAEKALGDAGKAIGNLINTTGTPTTPPNLNTTTTLNSNSTTTLP